MSAGQIIIQEEEWALVALALTGGNAQKAKALYASSASTAETMRALVLIAREGAKSVTAVEEWDSEAALARARVMSKLEKSIAAFGKAMTTIDEADKAYVRITVPQVELLTNPHTAIEEAPVRASRRTGEKRGVGDYGAIVGHYIAVPRDGRLVGVWYAAGAREFLPCRSLEVAGVTVWYPNHAAEVVTSWSRCFSSVAGVVNNNGATSSDTPRDLKATNTKVWLVPDLHGVNGGTYGATLTKDWRQGSCTLEVVSEGDLEDRPGQPTAIAALKIDVEALIAERS